MVAFIPIPRTHILIPGEIFLSVRFNYKPGDLLIVEITAFRLERIFQPMRAFEFITGHMVYNPAYN